jgi:hypothetical protein
LGGLDGCLLWLPSVWSLLLLPPPLLLLLLWLRWLRSSCQLGLQQSPDAACQAGLWLLQRSAQCACRLAIRRQQLRQLLQRAALAAVPRGPVGVLALRAAVGDRLAGAAAPQHDGPAHRQAAAAAAGRSGRWAVVAAG